MRKPAFAYAKTKTQISCAVTVVFATRIVHSLYFQNLKFQGSRHLVWLYSLVSVGSGPKPQRQVFSQRGSYAKKVQNSCAGLYIFCLVKKIDCLHRPKTSFLRMFLIFTSFLHVHCSYEKTCFLGGFPTSQDCTITVQLYWL